ncbi:MAG TPA: SDR family oxidoreductase [Clostridia bacterium]|nr:SDR family oxidoreductase [Clostridia bacterium]
MKYNRLLEGKVAVITSGAHGMGKHVSVAYARHGAVCIINGRNPSGVETGEMLNEISPGSCFIRCDMSKREDVESFIRQVLERTDRVDNVTNVVGINQSDLTDQVVDERFEYTQQVNLYGIIRLARGFWPALQETRGNVVLISTIHSGPTYGKNSAYASSKSATNAFARALAVEGAQYGIRGNVVCPGGIYSGFMREMYFKFKDDPEKLLQLGIRGQFGHPDYGSGSSNDIANACLFLASDMAKHVTGATIMSDGGATFQSHEFRDIRIPPDYMELWGKFMQDRYEL